jgi:tropomyosin
VIKEFFFFYLHLKKKLASLRAEAEQANALAEEYEAKIKQLELEHTSKDHELLSIQIRAKNLEEQLDKTEAKLHTVSAE